MEGKITYHQQVSYCGKPRCRRCREGTGHGPYWYAYQTVNGRTVRTYVGKNPPAEALQGTSAVEEGGVGVEARAAELASVVVRISVLGQFSLERREDAQRTASSLRWQPITDAALQHQRVRLLFTCLLNSPGRKIGREQAIDLLWPDLDFETASHRLDKAVHSLRQALEPGRSRPATSTLLLTEHATLQLADQSRIWIDADAFESLLAQARASSDPGLTEQLLEEAALLYGGDYLPDERGLDWTQARRESLQRGWIGLLLELADLRIAREAIPSAIDTLDRLLAIDATNEAAVQRLIVLLVQSGRRGEALRIYQRFATLLKQEYRIAPLPETRALYDTARRGEDIQARHSAASLTDNLIPAQESARAAEADVRPHMQVGRSNQSQLVGREQEVAALQELLHTTEQARRLKLAGQKRSAAPLALDVRRSPQCVLLMGDVGIGKTRLAEELGRDARRRGWTVTWTRAYAQETSIPYRMWTETLRKAMSQGLWQRQEIARRPLVYQALRALLPELEDLLPPPDTTATSPEQEQLRLWEATRALLVTISESAPMLIVLDDLQWSDSSSCELLAYLVRQLRGHPILLAGTCRDIELPQGHPLRSILNDLQREQAVETINVQPLTDDQIRALVSAHSGLSGLPGLPEPIVKHIQARAAGNPFFAEELARNVESGLTSSDQFPDARANHHRETALDLQDALPDTISAVLDLRMGRISSACQRLLVRAAVLGGAFEFNTLLAMESGPTALDEDTILDLLEEGLQAGMLTEEGSGTRITYHFWHPLLVSHLYDGLSAGRRASLHRRAAEVLLATGAGREEEEAAAIVYHLVNGGADSTRIARYAELAGDRAYALSAYPEAARHYRLAIEHTGELLPDASAEQHLNLANLLERLGECTRIQGKPEEARRYYEQALEVRQRYRRLLPQSEMSYEASIDALLWVEIGKTWFNIRRYEQAQQCYTQAEKILDDIGITISPVRAVLQFERSYILWQEGDFKEATQVALKALKNFENVIEQQNFSGQKHSTTIRRTLAGDPVDLGRTHLLLGSISGVTGLNSDALEHLNTALAIFEQYERQREIAIVCGNIGDVHLRHAEYPSAQAALRRSLGIAERIGDIPIMSVAYGNLGIVSTRSGELTEAEVSFRKGIELAEQVNDPVYISLLESYLTPVLQDLGKIEEARSTLFHALKISRISKFAPCIGCSLIALGQLRILQVLEENQRHTTAPQHQFSLHQQLWRTRKSLQRALALEGLEAETRTEGQLALARATFLLGEINIAQEQVEQVIVEARRLEQTWLLASAQRLLGSIRTAQKEYKAADTVFEEAIETFRGHGMRLEEARTLFASGESLLQRQDAASRAKGLQRLKEAREMFEACHASLDLALADRTLAAYTATSATA